MLILLRLLPIIMSMHIFIRKNRHLGVRIRTKTTGLVNRVTREGGRLLEEH